MARIPARLLGEPQEGQRHGCVEAGAGVVGAGGATSAGEVDDRERLVARGAHLAHEEQRLREIAAQRQQQARGVGAGAAGLLGQGDGDGAPLLEDPARRWQIAADPGHLGQRHRAPYRQLLEARAGEAAGQRGAPLVERRRCVELPAALAHVASPERGPAARGGGGGPRTRVGGSQAAPLVELVGGAEIAHREGHVARQAGNLGAAQRRRRVCESGRAVLVGDDRASHALERVEAADTLEAAA
ncbi:MAG: hypothetical protein QM820_37320 [Minicystis sp.]